MGMKEVPVDYDYDDVNDWLQRCMEDYPMIKDFPDLTNAAIRDAWFYEWFSQFRNNKE